MAAFALAALAGVSFGALAVTVRLGLARRPDPELAAFVIAAVGCVLAAAAAAGSYGDASLRDALPFVAIGAGVPGISQILFVRAIRDAGPSRAAVLIGTAPLISAALAVLFLDEPLGPVLGIATALIVLGGMALAGEAGRPAHFKVVGAVLALACAVLFAIRDNLVRSVARDGDLPPLVATTASLAGAAVALGVYLLVTRRGRLGELRPGATAVVFLPAAVSLAVAYGALLEAFDRGSVTVVAPLNATQSLWAVLFSVALLRRSEAIGRRVVAAALLVVVGSALIGATR